MNSYTVEFSAKIMKLKEFLFEVGVSLSNDGCYFEAERWLRKSLSMNDRINGAGSNEFSARVITLTFARVLKANGVLKESEFSTADV